MLVEEVRQAGLSAAERHHHQQLHETHQHALLLGSELWMDQRADVRQLGRTQSGVAGQGLAVGVRAQPAAVHAAEAAEASWHSVAAAASAHGCVAPASESATVC